MAPAKSSASDEVSFMADLLGGLDNDAFFAAVPSPDPSPIKPQATVPGKRTPRSPTKPRTPKSSKVYKSSPLKQASVSIHDVDMDALTAGVGTDWDDMEEDFLSPCKRKKTAAKAMPSRASNAATAINDRDFQEPCTRCVIETITEEETPNGRYQKTLMVKVDYTDRAFDKGQVVIQDDWADTDLRPGDIVNVLGSFAPSSSPSTSRSAYHTITISSKSHLLIAHPDYLLTATALSGATQCIRKPLLGSLVRSGPAPETAPSVVWGSMLHEVVQTCLQAGRWDQVYLEERIDVALAKSVGELVRIGISVEQARREVRARASGFTAFAGKYMAEQPKDNAILTDSRAAAGVSPALLAITRLYDVEEDIWSPTYGLKGKLDATVQARIAEPPAKTPFAMARTAAASRTGTVAGRNIVDGPAPFEIKTGRTLAAMEHRAQTMLYTLLTAERYGTPVDAGLLYYTQSEEVVRVPRARNEIRGLIGARNRMAGYMARRTERIGKDDADDLLPPTIDDERACGRCFAVDTCMLYRKAVENVEDTSSPIADLYDLKTSHLSQAQASFFKQWEALISMEEGDLVRFKKELWTMGAVERERHGRCFADMLLDTQVQPEQAAAWAKIHQFTYRFIRNGATSAGASLLSGHMSVGEAVTVSIAPRLLALARGFVVELTPYEVVIGVDHALDLARLRALAQTDALVFRIDKDELFGGMGRLRDNLSRLFYASGDTRRLSLVVDLTSPTFDESCDSQDYAASSELTARLNPSQQTAVSRVLSARDYALVLGMPGTGKTTVIATLIRVLVALGKTVLLTSYTHSAVDNILIKLNEYGTRNDFGILRLGNVDKVHPDVRQYTLGMKQTATTVEQLENQVMAPRVVATTCLSIDHALFSRRTFDYCIVDEASQITLPTCLGPLRFADKFVLVGDHFQLPPLVRNPAARKGGLETSLFRRLSDAHPTAVVDLTHQYRMNKDIMLLSNKLIYGDRLRCGSEAVALRSLAIPDRSFLDSLHTSTVEDCCGQECWIGRLLSERCNAVFVDTDNLPAPDSRVGDLPQNITEAELVYQLTESLLACGVQQKQIGIISLYRQQVKLLGHRLQARTGVEILTADRSQGRDKDCIIVSLVRSNKERSIGDLVKDWRRMNVSFTRACAKLIIIGSRKTLQDAPVLSAFFSLMEKQKWILRLPRGADKVHAESVAQEARRTGGLYDSLNGEKRCANDALDSVTGKENEVRSGPPPPKKVKVTKGDSWILRGRPILRDLTVES